MDWCFTFAFSTFYGVNYVASLNSLIKYQGKGRGRC